LLPQLHHDHKMAIEEDHITDEELNEMLIAEVALANVGFVDVEPLLLLQYAIICKGDVEEVISRHTKCAGVKEKYGVGEIIKNDEVNQDVFGKVSHLFFKEWSAGCGTMYDGKTFFCIDSFINMYELKEEDPTDFFNYIFLQLWCTNSTIPRIRQGYALVIFGTQLKWSHVDVPYIKEIYSMLHRCYPCRGPFLRFVDVGVIFQAVFKVISIFLTQKILDRVQLLSLAELSEILDTNTCINETHDGSFTNANYFPWLMERLQERVETNKKVRVIFQEYKKKIGMTTDVTL